LPTTTVTVEQPGWFAPRDPAVPWPSFIHYTGFGTDLTDRPPIGFGAYGLVDPGLGARDTWPGNAVKVGEERVPTVVDPADGPFEVEKAALGRLADYVAHWLPGLDPTPLHAETCLFTSTPTSHFVLDRRGPIVVASPCSGHGFKFAPLIGRMVADLALGAAEPRPPFLLGQE
jgi:sarcosine oxidase